jgi:hypothetical protein
MSEREPREDWDMNRDGGGAWERERRTPTSADRIRAAAREAGRKAVRVFGKGRRD